MFGFNNKKKVLIIGMPDLVLYCLNALKRARKNVVGVVTSPVGDVTYEYMKNFLRANNFLLIDNHKDFKDEAFLNKIRKLNPDVAFVCSFNYLLPKEFYEIPKLKTINFHPSLLPDYRGANPYYHVLMNREKETGVTMHYMDETFDTGDIIKQIKVPILNYDTMSTLFDRLNQATAELCVETINRLEKGEVLPRIPQNITSDYKKAPKIRSGTDDVRIDWNKSLEDIELFTRALNSFFGAVSFYDGKEVKFWEVDIVYNEAANVIPAGTICEIDDEAIYIAGKGGFIKTRVIEYNQVAYASDTQAIVSLLNLQKGKSFK